MVKEESAANETPVPSGIVIQPESATGRARPLLFPRTVTIAPDT
jgi:hypothetical protein